MEKLPPGWKKSIRDNEMHRLDWGKDDPQLIIEARKRLKERIIELNKEMGNTMNLKKEFPSLFNE